jgi:glycosyltransferase involved in cell wall biosynthesis
MNIVIANTQEFNPQIGGVERVSSILASEFIKLGHQVFFIACNTSPFSGDYIPSAPQKILPDSVPYNTEKNIEVLYNFLRENQIDILINQAGNIKAYSALCFKAVDKYKKTKIVSVIHIDPINRFRYLLDLTSSILTSKKSYKNIARLIVLPYRLIKMYLSESNLYNFVYQNSDSTVLLSNEFKKDFKKVTRLSSYKKLTAISNPFPFDSKQSQDNIKKVKKILYVGRLDYHHKRTDRLIAIWEKLAPDFPDWSLDIVGNGPLKEELLTHVKINNIARINFIGFANPIEYYEKSQILCMTSTYEGFGMVLIEAGYYGCIPIAFNSFSSLSDIIDNGLNGYMIKPYSLSQYEEKLRLLMRDDAIRNTIQRETHNTYKKFNSYTITKQWITLFANLLNTHGTKDTF